MRKAYLKKLFISNTKHFPLPASYFLARFSPFPLPLFAKHLWYAFPNFWHDFRTMPIQKTNQTFLFSGTHFNRLNVALSRLASQHFRIFLFRCSHNISSTHPRISGTIFAPCPSKKQIKHFYFLAHISTGSM